MKRVSVAVVLLALLGGIAWYVITAMTPVIVVSDIDSIRHSTAPPPAWAKVAPEQIAEAKKHGVPVAFENDLGMRFVLIPAGTFTMGSPWDEEGREDRETAHKVTLTKPYYMQITEVTNAAYRAVFPDHDSGEWEGVSLRGEKCPVSDTTWTGASRFVEALSRKDEAREYRLPTEAQWERACRAGTTTRYWWGDAESGAEKFVNAADQACKRRWGHNEVFEGEDGHLGPAPVGSYAPNPWGLYDMLGNVYEWCRDWYGPFFARHLTDPSGPDAGEWRVERGGSWYTEPRYVRSANRCALPPNFPVSFRTGFRLVSPLPESSK